MGYELAVAHSGEAAVQAAAADDGIDLILMDIDLGRGLDGTEAARIILEKRDVPIVFLTSHAEREMVEKVRGITRYGYVVKNSGDFVLESCIEMAFELFEAHTRMRSEERKLETILRTLPDLIWLKDANGVYLRCNSAFERFFGAKEAEIVGKTDYDFVDAELASFFRERDRAAMAAGKPTVNNEWITFADSGVKSYLETIKTPLLDDRGALVGVLGIARDITEHHETVEALRASRTALEDSERSVRDKLRAIVEPAVDLGALELGDIIDAPTLRRIIEEFHGLTGMNIGIIDRKGRNLVSVGWRDICAKFHRAFPGSCRLCLESNEEYAANLAPGEIREYRCKNLLREAATPIHLGGVYMGNIKTGQFLYDDEAIDTNAFRAQAALHGYDAAEYLASLERVPRVARERVRSTMRFYLELAGLIGTLSRSNIRLARLVDEKEVLLRELRHRVKNSLALVSSLLSLSRDVVEDEGAERALREAVARVRSVSAIYEQLNPSDSIEQVDIGRYAGDLVESVRSSYTDPSFGIDFRTDIPSRSIPLKDAVPLGLILNELLTNAVKYAYPDGKGGAVRIDFAESGGLATLTVSDDGSGMPAGFDPARAESMGLRIAEMLAKQLGGALRFREGAGTTAELSFPLRRSE